MTFECQTVLQAEQPVLSIRTRTSVQNLKNVLGKCYMQVFQHLQSLGEQPCGAPFVAYYNMNMEDLDVEIGVPVGKPLPGAGEVQAAAIPAGMIATTLYTGPYDQMPPAYEALTRFITEHNYQPTGVSYEFYLNDPVVTLPAELKTQIVFPLKG